MAGVNAYHRWLSAEQWHAIGQVLNRLGDFDSVQGDDVLVPECVLHRLVGADPPDLQAAGDPGHSSDAPGERGAASRREREPSPVVALIPKCVLNRTVGADPP